MRDRLKVFTSAETAEIVSVGSFSERRIYPVVIPLKLKT